MSIFRAPERRDFSWSSAIPSPTDGYWNASGHPVTTDTALRLGAVYACVGLIADALSTTPIDSFRRDSSGRHIHLPTPSLLASPSGTTELVEWMFSYFASLLLKGNTYGLKDNYDGMGYPREIHLIHPDEVSVTERSREDPVPVYRFNGEEVPLRRVHHVKGFTLPGMLTGLSPIQVHAQAIGMGLAAEEYGARWFSDGAHPTATLETDKEIDQNQAETIKARVMSVLNRRREPIVLGKGLKWNQIQVTAAESAFLDTMRFSVNDVARIFHVPVEKIGGATEGGGSITYGNREANVIEFQTDALLPNAVRFEQHISRLLPGKQFVKFNMDAAIRVDLKTRYDAHAVGLEAGFLLDDEVREIEDRPPLEDQVAVSQEDAETIGALIRAGYEADSVVKAVTTGDLGLLVHTGRLPVTVQAPAPPPPPEEETE